MKLKILARIFYCLVLSISGSNLPFICTAQGLNGTRDGKLLRSELWQPFDVKTVKGDFYVSPKGNDAWSGTLAEPNATKTDGPFATITRAKLAVRELKTKVYLPKGKAIIAIARKLVRLIHKILSGEIIYKELSADDYFNKIWERRLLLRQS